MDVVALYFDGHSCKNCKHYNNGLCNKHKALIYNLTGKDLVTEKRCIPVDKEDICNEYEIN